MTDQVTEGASRDHDLAADAATLASPRAGHSPGPWQVDPNRRGDVQTGDGREVCSVWSQEDHGNTHVVGSGGGRLVPDEDSDANARLIAAAPELLAALEHITELFVDCAPLGELTEREVAVVNARAAIAKATGAGQ